MEKTAEAAKPASPQAKQGEGLGRDAMREAQAAALRRNLQRRKQAAKAVKPIAGEE